MNTSLLPRLCLAAALAGALTVAPSRLSQFSGKIPVLPVADFNNVLARVVKWLPIPFSIES